VTTDIDPDSGMLRTSDEVAKAAAIAFTRIFLGVMWLFELTVGKNWILGGLGSDVHAGWLGAERGAVLRDGATEAIADGTWSWFVLLYEILLSPSAEFFAWLTLIAQLGFAVAFIVGVLVRPAALLALLMDLSILMLGNSSIPPFFTAMHLFVLATGAGRYYGLDGWLLSRLELATTPGRKALAWLLELPFLNARLRAAALAATALLALYFFLAIPGRETTRIQLVSLALSAILGIVAFALYASNLIPDRLGVIVASLRIFVGFKLIHGVWVTTAPGIDVLPGWTGGRGLGSILLVISEHHWPVAGRVVDAVFLPAVGWWAFAFGAVQLAVGVMLLVGFRTRLASLAGASYLTVLLLLGFTRYAPFVLGLLVPVMALDGGRYLSVDRVQQGFTYQERFGLPIPRRWVVPLLVLATVNAVAAAVTAFVYGIEPGAYVESMPSMVTAMVAIFSGALAGVGWLQQRPEASITPIQGREFLSSWA
jgi:uncharacterized membrane protein YphA (DoxX/SURF4 family)